MVNPPGSLWSFRSHPIALRTGGDGDDQERAFRPLLRELCLATVFHEADSLVEGHVVHPLFAAELRDSDLTVQACFIGMSRIDPDVFLANQGRNTWLLQLDLPSRKAEIESVITASKKVKAEAEAFGFPYVDMAAGPFDAQVAHALQVMGIRNGISSD